MLDKILQTKISEINNIKLPEQVSTTTYSLRDALVKENEVQVIAEVKKASPSKGLIRSDFDPVTIAKSYERGGAAALSVLTDVEYFQGSKDYLTSVKQEVGLPVLRKDFIIDSVQVEESVRIGADAILLIAAALETNQLHELYEEAYEKGLEVLVEFHSEEELERVLHAFKPDIIGVNNRDLRTFHTTLQTTEQLKKHIPSGSVFVSESGIYSYQDIQYVQKQGANAVLVGESLMRQENVEQAVRLLKGEESHESSTL
ncbi:indole-3-glycerol phosphate synthase TrpC [Alteribacillus iranensis]|uniref:Indole-3-glycerol phosphate synthase n=1 Tax=Alteribacillus iranensis TaxID=930128 RepID=A0A1I1ZTX0_9BACI|nr:indole-3-glycerol phosphate synthase TrpC [Alteribacillus iranensis]SFE34053.1 indole-3-glycerol phosphate synthase [Alteribacillus iranensis]